MHGFFSEIDAALGLHFDLGQVFGTAYAIA
jgi:hypothetical protein